MIFNDIAIAGLVTVFAGAMLVYLKAVPMQVWTFIKFRKFARIEIMDRELAYVWLYRWLAEQDDLMGKTRRLTVKTLYYKMIFVLGIGNHLFKYNGHWFLINHTRKDTADAGFTLRPQESFEVTCLFKSKQTFLNMLEDARNKFLENEEDKIEIYQVDETYWDTHTEINRRSIKTVPLPNNAELNLLEDVKNFISSESWYQERAVPHRRSYLLKGVPGSGKSSLIKAIASEIEYNIAILSFGEKVDDSVLLKLFVSLPKKTILILEDIDALYNFKNKVTFSGLLNALDGVGSKDGLITFMTTNHPERLDPALVRSGRVDYELEFYVAKPDQVESLYRIWHPDGDAEAFAKLYTDGTRTMSDIQEILLRDHHVSNNHGRLHSAVEQEAVLIDS